MTNFSLGDLLLDGYTLSDRGEKRGAIANEPTTAERFYENGGLARAVLNQDTLYQRRLYKGGTELGFYPTGELQYGTFARDETFGFGYANFVFASGSTVQYHFNGMVRSGRTNRRVTLGRLYQGTSGNLVIKEGAVSFYASGAFALGALVNGIAVFVGESEPVIAAGEKVTFHDYDINGAVSIKEAKVTGGFRFLNFEAAEYSSVIFYPGTSVSACGPPQSFKTAYATLEQGFTVAANQPVDLYRSGRLRFFEMGASATMGAFEFLPGETLRLYETGRLQTWTPIRDVVINGATYPADAEVNFNERGDVI